MVVPGSPRSDCEPRRLSSTGPSSRAKMVDCVPPAFPRSAWPPPRTSGTVYANPDAYRSLDALAASGPAETPMRPPRAPWLPAQLDPSGRSGRRVSTESTPATARPPARTVCAPGSSVTLLHVGARDAAQVGAPAERVVEREAVHQHQNLVRTAAPELGEAGPAAPVRRTAMPSHPSSAWARSCPARASSLPPIEIPPLAASTVTLSSWSATGTSGTATVRSSPGSSSMTPDHGA